MTEQTPTPTPKFFLHDEVKLWLANNLVIHIEHHPNKSPDYTLANKLGVPDITVGHAVHVSLKIDGEIIAQSGFNLINDHNEQTLKALANVTERCMIEINDLTFKIGELRRRLDLIENPPL
jgi:hypothetical protein